MREVRDRLARERNEPPIVRTLWRVNRGGDPTETSLANGMPLVEMPMPGRLATTIAIAFPAGARHEAAHEVGAAHLLEHMAFKGSENHPTSTELNRAAECLGTELDGSAMQDYVEFGSVVRAESAMATIDLLSDVCGRALLDQAHLELERAVILREIADADEDPGTRADDRVTAALFAGHRLATSTAGRAPDVERLTHDQVLSFRERQWSPEGGMVAVAGNLDHLDREPLEELLLRIPTRARPPAPPPIGAFQRRVNIEERDSDIVHLRLAYAVPGLDLSRARDRAMAEVYSDLLGGPMGSRLHEELREQRGLCYWIDGGVWGYEDASFLSVGCSVRAPDLTETYLAVEAIITDLRERGPSEEESARARSYAGGSAALGFESTRARADHAVELIMEYGDHDVDPVRHLSAIESVTRKNLAEVAAQVEPGPCVGCVGPVTAGDLT
jgi:predicted Zn-dependent peptidase